MNTLLRHHFIERNGRAHRRTNRLNPYPETLQSSGDQPLILLYLLGIYLLILLLILLEEVGRRHLKARQL